MDGTQKYVMTHCYDLRYLKRNIRGKDNQYHYYSYILEAVIIFSNGMVLPVMSEFLENTSELESIESDEERKQDCYTDICFIPMFKNIHAASYKI